MTVIVTAIAIAIAGATTTMIARTIGIAVKDDEMRPLDETGVAHQEIGIDGAVDTKMTMAAEGMIATIATVNVRKTETGIGIGIEIEIGTGSTGIVIVLEMTIDTVPVILPQHLQDEIGIGIGTVIATAETVTEIEIETATHTGGETIGNGLKSIVQLSLGVASQFQR